MFPSPEPTYDDYVIAFGVLSGRPQRSIADQLGVDPSTIRHRIESVGVIEARYRIEHQLRDRIAAGRAMLIDAMPELIETLVAAATDRTCKWQGRALEMALARILPAAPSEHRIVSEGGGGMTEEDLTIMRRAGDDFHRLTNDLHARLAAVAPTPIRESKHLLRGPAAKSSPISLERPQESDE